MRWRLDLLNGFPDRLLGRRGGGRSAERGVHAGGKLFQFQLELASFSFVYSHFLYEFV